MPKQLRRIFGMSKGCESLRKSLKNFIAVPKSFYKLAIGNTALRVLLYLMDGRDAWNPSYAQIAAEIGLGIREVQRAVQFLVKSGIIRQISTGHALKNTTNKYDLTDLESNIEKYLKNRPGMKVSKGRCLYPEPDFEESVNPATPALNDNVTQGGG